jgi:integrase
MANKGIYEKTIYPGIFKYTGTHGTVYGIDYYSGGKKHREIVGSLLGEAKTRLSEKREQAKDGIVIQKRNTFRKLAQEYAKFDCENPSYNRTHKYYIGYWENQEDGTVSWKDMTLTKGLKKERSNVSVNRELGVLRRMLNKAIEWRWLEKNPFRLFQQSVFYGEDSSRARFLSPDEMVRLFDALDHPKTPPYLKPIVMGDILLGLRRSDLLKLQWKDINKEKGYLTYLDQKKSNSRNRDPKTVVKYINQDMIDLLNGMPILGDYVFCDSEGKPFKDLSQSFKTVLKRAGITNFHFHDLRHTSASYLLMRGAPLEAVQKHLNHRDLKTTQRYAHISEHFQREQVSKLDGLFDGIQNNSKNLVRTEQKENATA